MKAFRLFFEKYQPHRKSCKVDFTRVSSHFMKILHWFLVGCFLLKAGHAASFNLGDSNYELGQKKPPITLSKRLKPLIVLDAGHGGSDEGTTLSAFKEKRIALITTLMTKNFLEEMGYRVILTRSKDAYVSLAQRVLIANKNKGSLFVSIHYNAAKNRAAKGVEVFYCNAKDTVWRTRSSRRLANCILYHLLDETQAHSRGVKTGNHHVTRETNMPAVLVEGGFITNREERSLLKEKKYLERVAKGISLGIDKYLKT